MSATQNPLEGLRICLAGTFRMPTPSMNKELRQLGVAQIDRVTMASEDRTTTPPPAKETTNLFVVGSNPPEDCLSRYELNCHDGYCAVKITEDQLYELMRGEAVVDIPKEITKHVSLDYNYYEWESPVAMTSRISSPMKYNLASVLSPVAGLEVYVPVLQDYDRYSLCQLIGNFGGFANTQDYSNTDIVMIGDDTVAQLKNGIKDATIQQIEDAYNKSNTKIFSIRFSRVSDFLEWVKYRLELCPDPASQKIFEKLTLWND